MKCDGSIPQTAYSLLLMSFVTCCEQIVSATLGASYTELATRMDISGSLVTELAFDFEAAIALQVSMSICT